MPDPDRRATGAILGICADFHDSAACLLIDGRIVGAAEEERFSRIKHDAGLPVRAVEWCLEAGGIEPGDLDAVAFYEKPFTRYERILRGHADAGPRGLRRLTSTLGSWSRRKLWVSARIERMLDALGHPMPRLVYAEHHLSHAAAAFYTSPFEHAAVLTVDGVGEWTTATIGRGSGHRLTILRELRFPGSIGLFYSAITAFCGFDANDGEYKLMGLAPYGTPRFVDPLLDRAITVADDGAVELSGSYFDFSSGRRPDRPSLARLLDGPAREPGAVLGQREADIAASAQRLVELVLTRMARTAFDQTGEIDLCLGGGVAHNCVANELLERDGPFRHVWVPPAPGDAGTAVGAALWAWHELDGEHRNASDDDGWSGSFIGPSFHPDEIEKWLSELGIPFVELDEHELDELVASELAGGAIVGRFAGPMEFGPRALGNRSILADPRDPTVVERLNRSVKRREAFRPFAPAVLEEHVHEWFDVPPGTSRPYMTHTVRVRDSRPVAATDDHDPSGHGGPEPGAADTFADRLASVRSPIPACTHVDGSARVQTVRASTNPRFHALISTFRSLTGCPVVLNTSFNRAGEPIVRTPADALRCHLDAGLDLLALERFVIRRDDDTVALT